jgi:hypothetical protein
VLIVRADEQADRSRPGAPAAGIATAA